MEKISTHLEYILRATPIEAIGKYQEELRKENGCTNEHKIKTLKGVGIENLLDWYNKDLAEIHRSGFSATRYIGLQDKFRNMVQDEKFQEDLGFWAPKSFPRNYCADKTLFENIDEVLKDLLWFVDGCSERTDQIPYNRDIKKVELLHRILRPHYKENESLKGIARVLGKDEERTRQLIKDELLTPLLKGEIAQGESKLFAGISINNDLLEQIRRYDGTFSLIETPLSDFVKDVLKIDLLKVRFATRYIIVPSETTGCYKVVLTNLVDELTKIVKPIQVDELLVRIGQNQKIQSSILRKNKDYSEKFITNLLEETDLVDVSEEDGRIIINHRYIKHNQGVGGVHKERALARIIADANRPITEDEIKAEYLSRYDINLGKNVNLSHTNNYGMVAVGKTAWEYNTSDARKPLQERVEDYSRDNRAFYFKDIKAALEQDNYIFNPRTLRTYITNCCQVDNRDKDHFCYSESIGDYPDYTWRRPVRSGVVNWLANELRLLFNDRQKDCIHISEVNRYLYERGQGTEFAEDAVYGYTPLISTTAITSDLDSPFVINRVKRGDWSLCKNGEKFDTTNWETIGTKGREWEHKLLVLAANIVRKTHLNRMLLTELVRSIVTDEEVDGLSERQIRKKLMEAIRSNISQHPLVLWEIEGRLHVGVDARRIQPASRYKSENNIQITYQTVSQLAPLNWEELREVMKQDMYACSRAWYANNEDFYQAFDRLVDDVIQKSRNRNLNTIFPQRLYEFFFVENPTDDDRYCIMCSIAKNFEGLLSEIYYRRTGNRLQGCHGLWNLTQMGDFNDFNNILNNEVSIWNLVHGGWERTLKTLSFVRNTDAHGEWFVDNDRNDPRPESKKTIEKIRRFAALYVFAVAKYLPS